MTNRTGEVYVENDIKLLWSIGSSTDYEKNQIRQLRDW